MTMIPLPGRSSDDTPEIAAFGQGDSELVLWSMSQRCEVGDDRGYLEWHLFDHLPEQYRLTGVRHGARFVSTPAARAARAVSAPPFDAVDHLVGYWFAQPTFDVLDGFFKLGGALGEAGRMPRRIPSVHLGAYRLVGRAAAESAKVGAAVLPWRPAGGLYLVIEQFEPDSPERGGEWCGALADLPGVLGWWRTESAPDLHPYLRSPVGEVVTMVFLDDNPVGAAGPIGELVGSVDSVRLAAPFVAVDPWNLGRALPDVDLPPPGSVRVDGAG